MSVINFHKLTNHANTEFWPAQEILVLIPHAQQPLTLYIPMNSSFWFDTIGLG